MNRRITLEERESLLGKLNYIFDNNRDKVEYIEGNIEKIIDSFSIKKEEKKKSWVDEKDVYLITYGDSLVEKGKKPLNVLNDFAKNYLEGAVNNIHILPFFPWTSDDGFSVVDYWKIDPNLGEWKDVKEISENFKMMYDAVVNHISASSTWFQGFLNGDEKYKDYFICKDWSEDLKKVTRPRIHPVLTKFETPWGEKNVWTTFSEDQIDINFENSEVFLEMIKLLLFYVEMGAKSIRLDAIGYMWKDLGTSCIHHPKAHMIIKLWREIFEIVAPNTILISETNVPHKDNISYFGNGKDEVKMVYQFPMPPLTVHTLQTGDSTALTNWAKNIKLESDETTFFNFLSSHDGIGVVPATGLLTEQEIKNMVEKVKENGGKVSYKTNSDGSQSPYEMNINYLEALSNPTESQEMRVKKFLSAQMILLSFIGTPAIYIHSLLGSLNDFKGLEETGRNRSINREKLNYQDIKRELKEPNHRRNQVFSALKKLLEIRKNEGAFNPMVPQEIIEMDKRVFALKRKDRDKEVLLINNISSENVKLTKLNEVYWDIISQKEINSEYILSPYEYLWLKRGK